MEKKDIPICHSEPMTPVLRYKEDGKILVRYQCGFCFRDEIAEVVPGSLREKKNELIEKVDRFLKATRKIVEIQCRNENDRILKGVTGKWRY